MQMNTTVPTEVANIVEQIGGIPRLNLMIGGKEYFFGTDSNDDYYFRFRFGRGAKNKANILKITYVRGVDLYKVEFIRVHGTKVTNISTFEGVYFDSLVELFENETSLYLSLY